MYNAKTYRGVLFFMVYLFKINDKLPIFSPWDVILDDRLDSGRLYALKTIYYFVRNETVGII